MASPGKWPPPGFPLVSGDYALTEEWSIRLPEQFARRAEDGQLVLWRPGLTIRLGITGNEDGASRADRLVWVKADASPGRFDERESDAGGVSRYSYRLSEDAEAVHGFAFSDEGHVQLAVTFDDPAEEDLARSLAEAVAPRPKA